jgi:hypothetical protein
MAISGLGDKVGAPGQGSPVDGGSGPKSTDASFTEATDVLSSGPQRRPAPSPRPKSCDDIPHAASRSWAGYTVYVGPNELTLALENETPVLKVNGKTAGSGGWLGRDQIEFDNTRGLTVVNSRGDVDFFRVSPGSTRFGSMEHQGNRFFPSCNQK